MFNIFRGSSLTIYDEQDLGASDVPNLYFDLFDGIFLPPLNLFRAFYSYFRPLLCRLKLGQESTPIKLENAMRDSTKTSSSSPLQIANLNTFNPKTSLHFSDTYVFREKNTSRTFGELFIVIQIDNATRTSAQVADAVATILQHEYYRGNPSDAAKNFEDALHKTNEILSDLAARGEIHWIGKLHSVICVVKGDEIHVSATGRGKAYLIRKNELAEVSQGLYDTNRAASPLKTFEHQASGDLLDGDGLLLTSPSIPDQLSVQNLKQILQNNDPLSATEELHARVGKDSTSASSAVILAYDSNRQAVVSATAGKKKETKTVALASQIELQGSAHSEADLSPLESATASSAAKASKKKNRLGFLKDLKGRFQLSRKQRKLDKAELKPQKKAMAAAPTRPVSSPAAAKANKTSGFKAGLGAAFKRIPTKAKVIGSLAVLAVFIFVVSLFVFGDSKQIQAERETILATFNEAKSMEELAASAIIFKDFTEALSLLDQSDSKLNEISGDETLAGDIEALRAAIAADREKLSGAVNIDEPTVLAAFLGEAPNGIVLADGSLLLWSGDGEIASVSITEGNVSNEAAIDSSLGAPLFGVVDEQGDLIMLTDDAELVSFADAETTGLDISGTFTPEGPVSLASYGNRLYILDPEAGNISRHQQTLAGYTQGEDWILDGTDVSDAVDFAIDGNIWVLHADGKLTKMLQGSQEDYTLGSLVDPLENPTQFYTAEDMSFIYILEPDKQRLVQYDKDTGEFVKQYNSDKFDDLKDMVIVEDGQTGFLLNGKTIFQINLQS